MVVVVLRLLTLLLMIDRMLVLLAEVRVWRKKAVVEEVWTTMI